MHPPLSFSIRQQQLWLSPEKAIYWENNQALILSDLHLGKTGHFRKSGIAVPQQVYKEDLQRLVQLLQHFQPRQLIVVGDLFHSHENKELDWFLKWRNDFPLLDIHLVKGNHDILSEEWYTRSGMQVHTGTYDLAPFSFTHDPEETVATTNDHYQFTGHIHPGVLLKGLGKQSLRFPCFFFGREQAILPAFGGFTGVALVEAGPGDAVYAIVEKSLICLQ